jgi:carboxymethylenebutenolidase
MQFNEFLTLDDGTLGLYVQGSKSPDVGAVVVLQEIFGVNATIRSTVDNFAKLGFRAVAPDLYWRQRAGIELSPDIPDSRPVAMELSRRYRDEFDTNLIDSAALVTDLRKTHRKVAVIGYCLGGQVAFHSWLTLGLDAVVSYYGVGIDKVLDQVTDQRTPLLMHMGADDVLNPPDVQASISAALSGRQHVTVQIYPNVGHAFARQNSQAYVSEAATQADRATCRFLEKHMS